MALEISSTTWQETRKKSRFRIQVLPENEKFIIIIKKNTSCVKLNKRFDLHNNQHVHQQTGVLGVERRTNNLHPCFKVLWVKPPKTSFKMPTWRRLMTMTEFNHSGCKGNKKKQQHLTVDWGSSQQLFPMNQSEVRCGSDYQAVVELPADSVEQLQARLYSLLV